MSIQQEIATPRSAVAKKRNLTRTITYTATLCAFCIVLKWLSNVLSLAVPMSIKISLAYFGWFSSAIILGPFLGGGVAALSDLLGQFILQTGGAPNIINLFGNFISTTVFGLIFHYFPTKKLPKFISVIINTIVGAIAFAIVGTLGINTFGLWVYYYSSVDYWVFLDTRLIQLIMLSVNTVLCISITPALIKLKLVWFAGCQSLKSEPTPTSAVVENANEDLSENNADVLDKT